MGSFVKRPKPGTRNFIQGVQGSKYLVHLWLSSQVHQPGSGSDVDEPGLQLVLQYGIVCHRQGFNPLCHNQTSSKIKCFHMHVHLLCKTGNRQGSRAVNVLLEQLFPPPHQCYYIDSAVINYQGFIYRAIINYTSGKLKSQQEAKQAW